MDDAQRMRAAAREGTLLKNKWRLTTLLGVGGVASVYAASHRNGSRAAIKILHPEYSSDTEVRSRFLLEGYAANTVDHSGAVRVLDDDRTDDGVIFVVMELLEGETLEQRAARNGGSLPCAEVLVAVSGVLDVLTAAHDKAVFHRDLKPDNIFLTESGDLKVLDFGLAHMSRPLNAPRSATRLGWMMGTPGFMPPEQVRGQWELVDGRSDLWAVGATMYALLSGRRVHSEASEEDAFVAAVQPVPSLAKVAPNVPGDVVGIVDRALALDRATRFQTAPQMRLAISAALDTIPDRPAWTAGAPHSPRSDLPSVSLPSVVTTRRAPHPDDSLTGGPRSIEGPRASKPPSIPGSLNGVDNTEPVEIAPDTFWVGKRDPRAILHANPYLRVFRGIGGDRVPFYLLIDPGSSSDFAVVSNKVGKLAGHISRVSAMFINHQDPDVGSSAALISARYAPTAPILCSEATWRLIVHLNLQRDRFVNMDAFEGGYPLPTGHIVIPVPSPFCHFRGALMLYDPATRVLFSGDLFGGITSVDADGLFADDSDWSGVRAFHQVYMPATKALARAVDAIRRLEPKVELIAPQHGRLLRGPLITTFLDRIERLPVGLDILDDENCGPESLAPWNSVMRRVFATARIILGSAAADRLSADPSLQGAIIVDGDSVTITALGRWALSTAVLTLTRGESAGTANPIKLEAVFACEELDLPAPDITLEADADPA